MKLSIIMPVCSHPNPRDEDGAPHPHLPRALESVLRGGHPDVELLVGIDGHRPRVWNTVNAFAEEHPELAMTVRCCAFRGAWGNPQRNALIPAATGDLIHFQDQDDEYAPGSLATVAAAAAAAPGRPLVFKMAVYQYGNHTAPRAEPDLLWKTRGRVECGHIGGHMLFVPNVPELLGRWEPEDRYEADFGFISTTLGKFAAAGREAVWHNEVICRVRPWARPGGAP